MRLILAIYLLLLLSCSLFGQGEPRIHPTQNGLFGAGANSFMMSDVASGGGVWATNSAAFNALMPTATTGQLLRYNGTAWVPAIGAVISNQHANFGQLANYPTYADANTPTNWGWNFINGSTNTPLGLSNWYIQRVSLGADYTATHNMELAFSRPASTGGGTKMYARHKEGTYSGWEDMTVGNWGQKNNFGNFTDFNSLPLGGSAVSGTTNAPSTGSTQWFVLQSQLATDYPNILNQFTISRQAIGNDKYLYFRQNDAGTWGAHSKIWAERADGLSPAGIAATNYWTLNGANVYRATGKVGIGIAPLAHDARLIFADYDLSIRDNSGFNGIYSFSNGSNTVITRAAYRDALNLKFVGVTTTGALDVGDGLKFSVSAGGAAGTIWNKEADIKFWVNASGRTLLGGATDNTIDRLQVLGSAYVSGQIKLGSGTSGTISTSGGGAQLTLHNRGVVVFPTTYGASPVGTGNGDVWTDLSNSADHKLKFRQNDVLATVATRERDFAGPAWVANAATYTLNQANRNSFADAVTVAITVNCDTNTEEGIAHEIKCRRNAVNNITLSAANMSGQIEYSGGMTIPGPQTLVLDPFGLYTVKRVGAVCILKKQ